MLILWLMAKHIDLKLLGFASFPPEQESVNLLRNKNNFVERDKSNDTVEKNQKQKIQKQHIKSEKIMSNYKSPINTPTEAADSTQRRSTLNTTTPSTLVNVIINNTDFSGHPYSEKNANHEEKSAQELLLIHRTPN